MKSLMSLVLVATLMLSSIVTNKAHATNESAVVSIVITVTGAIVCLAALTSGGTCNASYKALESDLNEYRAYPELGMKPFLRATVNELKKLSELDLNSDEEALSYIESRI